MAPAVVVGVLAVLHRFGARIAAWADAVLSEPIKVELLRDSLLNIAYIGSAVGALAGDETQLFTWFVTFSWFAAFHVFSLAAVDRLVQLNAQKDREMLLAAASLHRKTAGTVRSIVRDELARANGTKPPSSRSAPARVDAYNETNT